MTAEPRNEPQNEAPAILVRDLEKRYGSRAAVRGLSFQLPRDATLVVFGANGAGKTTLLRMLATIERPSSGELRVFGADPAEDGDGIRARLGLISHEPMLYPDLTAEENLRIFARLYGVPSPDARVREMLEAVKLTFRANDAVRGFSRGMTQRMSIARALIHDPDLVLLDEPYSGLDASAVAIARHLFLQGEDGNSERRRTLVLTSHDLDLGYRAATHVLLLSHGKPVLFAEKDGLAYDELSAAYRAQLAKGGAR